MSFLDLIFKKEFSEDDEDFKAFVAKAEERAEEKDKPAIKAAVKEMLTTEKSITDILGLEEGQEAKLYVDACKLYEAGQFSEAEALFTALYAMQPSKAKYSFGLAAAIHRQERYDEALMYYYASSGCAPEDPKAFYHAADCLRHLDMKDAAYSSLDTAMLYACDKPEYYDLMGMIDEEMIQLEKELGIDAEAEKAIEQYNKESADNEENESNQDNGQKTGENTETNND